MFEESKAWVFIFIVGVLIAIGYGTHYMTSVDSANAALIESKDKLADLSEILVQRKKSWAGLEKINALIRQDVEKNEVLTKAKEVLDKRYRSVDSDLKYTVESFTTTVEKMRNNAPGTDLGDITLANGKMLRVAKVRKIDETGISMIHADGIGNVTTDLLPAELKEKYDLGTEALLPILQDLKTAFLAKPESGGDTTMTKAKVSASLPTSKPAEPSSSPPTTNTAKVKEIKLKIAALDSQIQSARTSANSLEQQAADNYTNGDIAKSKGTPSSKYWNAAQQARQRAQIYSDQANALEAEKKKLQVELEFEEK